MATNSVPVSAWVAAVFPGAAVNQSSSLTGTFSITAGFAVAIPVACQFSNVSADPIVNIYRSMDGGVTYDTQPMSGFSISRISTGKAQASIILPTGQYAIQMQNSGPNTATFFINTAQVITAVNNA